MTDRGARSVGLVLALGGLLVVVDTTVTVVAVPAIVADLDSTLPVVQWVTSGYLLGVVAVIPIAGWAANRFGARRVYLAALVTFTLFSALCALAWSAGSLIAFRVLQGLGGGLLNPVGQAIGLRAVPRSQRGRMMSLLGLPVLIGPPLGPPLSGWLVDVASWRWIFMVNVPVGIVAVVLCTLVIPRFDASASGGPVDRLGLALLSGGAVSLVLGCTVLGDAGEATASALAGLLAGAVLLAAFARRALRIERPLIELRLLRHRPLGAGVAVLGCFGAAYFGAMSVLPIFVQAVRGDPAILAGLVGLPQALAVGLTLQVATRLVDRVKPRRIVLTGTSLGLLGVLALLVATSADAPYPVIATAAAVVGAGSGATLMPAMTAAVRDLEGADTARGTTLMALAQQLAAALGVAVVTTTLTVLVAVRAPGLPGDGGLAAMLALDPALRAALAPQLAAAVGGAYGAAAVLMALATLAVVIGSRESRPATKSR